MKRIIIIPRYNMNAADINHHSSPLQVLMTNTSIFLCSFAMAMGECLNPTHK